MSPFSFLLTPRPDPDFHYTTVTIIIILLLFAGSAGVLLWRRRVCKDAVVKKMVKDYPSKLLTFASILLLLLFFREAGIPFLSMRLLWVIYAGVLIHIVAREVLRFPVGVRNRRKALAKKAVKDKYLPKKKKRK